MPLMHLLLTTAAAAEAAADAAAEAAAEAAATEATAEATAEAAEESSSTDRHVHHDVIADFLFPDQKCINREKKSGRLQFCRV
jgi:Ni/Co efflux regulator RcnB